MPKGKYIRTDEIRKKNSLSLLGRHPSEEVKLKMKLNSTPYIRTGASKEKSRLLQLGRKYSIQSRIKMSLSHLGQPSWCKGKKLHYKTKPPMLLGKDNPNWQGGKSFELYTNLFNQQLKEKVRVRDNFKCRICGVPELELIERLHAHHIDYDKKNCDIDNLISLCRSCHTKTNYKRVYWKNYFLIKGDKNVNKCAGY